MGPKPRGTTKFGIASMVVLAGGFLGAPKPALTQVVISIPAKNITTGAPAACEIKPGPAGAVPSQATLKVEFLSDDAQPKPAKNPAKVLIRIDGIDKATIAPGLEEQQFPVAGDTLANGTVEIMREDAKVALCSAVPWPTPRTLVPNGKSFTAFVANGAVGKALKGSPTSDVTGSLGVDHRSVPTGLELDRLTKFSWRGRLVPWNSMGEELHAILTIASSADSLSSEDKAAYGAALLAPSLTGNGSFQGVTIEYHYFNPLNRAGGTWGPRAKLSVARSFWRVIDTAVTSPADTTIDTLRDNIPLSAFDVGLRFIFISHLEDPKQNTYEVGIDPSFVMRWAAPNTEAERRLVRSALSGSSRRIFAGTNFAFWIRLRQVTGVADLFYIPTGKKSAVDGLTGFQPVVTMKYSSPLFVF